MKQARGTYREDRDGGPEIAAEAGPPEPPEGLHAGAAAEWRRLAPIARRAGLLSDADHVAWRLGFEALSRYLAVSDELAGEPLYTTTDKGYPVASPLVAMQRQAWGDVMKFCREFGLTPSARSGLKLEIATEGAADPRDDDPFGHLG